MYISEIKSSTLGVFQESPQGNYSPYTLISEIKSSTLGEYRESPLGHYSGYTLISEIKSSALGDFKNPPKVITQNTPLFLKSNHRP